MCVRERGGEVEVRVRERGGGGEGMGERYQWHYIIFFIEYA